MLRLMATQTTSMAMTSVLMSMRADDPGNGETGGGCGRRRNC
jgi:hypothetical protein